jgi:hypothetical protein
LVIQASGHHPRVCGCCYCLPAPHARVAPLRVPGGNCRSGDQSPKVHGVHLVHVSKQPTSPKRAKDIARLACDAGRLAPSLNTVTRKKAACRLGLCRWRRVVTGSTPPVTTLGLTSVTTALGNAAAARCATVAANRKRLCWRCMRKVLASSDSAAGGAGQSRKMQRRALCGPQTARSVRAYLCKKLVLAMSRRLGADRDRMLPGCCGAGRRPRSHTLLANRTNTLAHLALGTT